MAKQKEKIELTPAEFREIASSVATDLCVEASEHKVSPMMIALITALFSAKLDTALFDEEELEVEQ